MRENTQNNIDPFFKKNMENIEKKYRDRMNKKINNKNNKNKDKKKEFTVLSEIENIRKNADKYKNIENRTLIDFIGRFIKNQQWKNNIFILGKSGIWKTTLIKKIFFWEKKIISWQYRKEWKNCYYIEEWDLLETKGEIRSIANNTKSFGIDSFPYEMALKTKILILDDVLLNLYQIDRHQNIYKRLLDYRIEKGLKTVFISNEIKILGSIEKNTETVQALFKEYWISENEQLPSSLFRIIRRMTGNWVTTVLQWKSKVKDTVMYI